MPSFQIGRAQAVGDIRQLAQQQLARRESAQAAKSDARPSTAGVAVETGVSVDAGEAPVDAQRVSEIRAAIEQGTYPVIPTRIADAMIAARLLLSSGS